MLNAERKIVKIVKEICQEYNIDLKLFSHDWIMQMEIDKKNVFIIGYQFQNNNSTAQQICGDKCALSEILEANEINVVPHHFFMSPSNLHYVGVNGNWIKMMELLSEYSSIVCKSNNGSGGNNVYRVTNQFELESAVSSIFRTNRSLAISPFYEIEFEYRIIVLNNYVELIYYKERPYIVGDGINSISKLCFEKFGDDCFAFISNLISSDIPSKGATVFLNWKHNLGQGAKAIIVNDEVIIQKLTDLAVSAVRTINANFASVDIIYTKSEYKILEINSGIMMEGFASQSQDNYEIAKEVYRKAIEIFFSKRDKKVRKYLGKINRTPIILPLLNKAAIKRNGTILMDEEYLNFCIYTFKNGKSFVVKDMPMNINSSGSVALTKNKSATTYFLNKMGYKCPKTDLIISKKNINQTIQLILELANNYEFPLIVKPNDMSQGQHVYKVQNQDELNFAARQVAYQCDQIIIQEYCYGKDYRIVVLGNNIISAYERIPFQIVGTGVCSIKELLDQRISEFIEEERDVIPKINDPRLIRCLSRKGYSFETVLSKDEVVILQDISNLSTGGTSRDITDKITPFYYQICVEIANKLNLKLCGIDIIAKSLESETVEDYKILEINSAPGLDNYQYSGYKQTEYVENLYERVYDFLSEQN